MPAASPIFPNKFSRSMAGSGAPHPEPTCSASLLRVEDLTKCYDRDGAGIDRVTFSAFSGEVLGIIGPNGAGKTTLLEAIAGLLAADAGRVLWRGEPLPPSDRRHALFYLPDGVRPYPDQWTAQVIWSFASMYRRSREDVRTIIAAVGLEPVLAKRVRELSKGYGRRLMLALGVLAPHDMLLMDEPFDGFDLRQTRDIIGLLRAQARRGRSLILAIHQLGDAQRVCDRFVLLAGGRVRGLGTLAELRTRTALPGGSLEEIFLALT
jgi:ABC-2 type transport system ATP-binding protein